MEAAAPEHPDRYRSPLSYYGFLASAAVFFVFLFPVQWIYGDQETAFDLLLPVAWLAMPVAGYLDIRYVREIEDVDWTPKGWLWTLGFVLPILNLSAAAPYLLRRHEKVERRESWSIWWRLALAGAGLLFLVLMAGFLVEEYLYDSAAVENAFTEATSLALVFGTVLSPVGVKYDVEYVKQRYDWQPDSGLWMLGAAIWFVNFFVLVGYAAKRNPDSEHSVVDEEEQSDEADDSTVERAPWEEPEAEEATGPQGDSTEPETSVQGLDSRWWYWPAATTALTVLLLAVGGYALYSYSAGDPSAVYGLAFQLVNMLLLLVLVSLISLYAIYRDAKAIEETDSNWQPFWLGYLLLGAFVSPLLPSVVYVVQRHRHLGTP